MLDERTAGLSAPLLILAVIFFLQCLPLPTGAAGLFSSAAGGIREASGTAGWAPLSLQPGRTLLAAARFALPVMVFLLCLNTLCGRREVRRQALFLILAGTGLALFAVFQKLTAHHSTIYGRPIGDWSGHPPFGSYVNRNHFAGLMDLAIPLGLGYALSVGSRRDGRRGLPLQLLAGLPAAVMAGALLMSQSRGGLLSTTAGLLAMGCYLALREGRRRFLLLAAGPIAAGAALVAWLGSGGLLSRFVHLSGAAGSVGADFRVRLYAATLGMIADFPLFGTGFGTFDAVFPLYQEFGMRSGFAHAHNEYLQVLAEGGVIALAAVCAALAIYFRKALSMLSRRRDRETLFLGAGALGGVAAFLAHALLDFNFRVPANALWFAFLAALAMKAIYSRSPRPG